MLHSQNHFSSSSLDSPQDLQVSCIAEPITEHSTPGEDTPGLSRDEGSPPSTCCQSFSYCSQGPNWPSQSQWHTVGSWSADPSPQRHFPAGQPPAPSTGAWIYSSLGVGLCTHLCWISRDSSLPISPRFSVKILLNCSTMLWGISHSSQFQVISKLAEEVLHPFIPSHWWII